MYDGIISKPNLDELYHHGIKGQKWGVQNGPPYPLDDKVSTGKSLKKAAAAAKKKKKRDEIKKNVKAYSKQYDKYDELEDRIEGMKMDKAELDKKAEAEYQKTKPLRKKLGKTGISRTYNVIKHPENKDVQAYNKQWDKYDEAVDKSESLGVEIYDLRKEADAAWKETRKLRKKIGKTPISRIYRTIKYDSPISEISSERIPSTLTVTPGEVIRRDNELRPGRVPTLEDERKRQRRSGNI